MRKPLGVLACLVSVAALSTPVATAHAATESQAACRVSVAKPQVNDFGRIQASATRRGCLFNAVVRVRIKRAQPGADPVVKSGARKSRNARVTIALPCAPGVYYAVATDYRGHSSKSRPVRLSCFPTDTPTPTVTPTTTVTPTPVPSSKPTTTQADVHADPDADEHHAAVGHGRFGRGERGRPAHQRRAREGWLPAAQA